MQCNEWGFARRFTLAGCVCRVSLIRVQMAIEIKNKTAESAAFGSTVRVSFSFLILAHPRVGFSHRESTFPYYIPGITGPSKSSNASSRR